MMLFRHRVFLPVQIAENQNNLIASVVAAVPIKVVLYLLLIQKSNKG